MIPPPLLVSFSTPDDVYLAMGDELDSDSKRVIANLIKLGRPPAVSAKVISLLFGFSLSFVQAMRKRPCRYYRRFELSAGKKLRVIHSPKISLKLIQSWFGYHLSRAITLSPAVHGFVPGRSTLTAARMHCGAEWLMTVDVRDFFPSTSRNRVSSSLEAFGYPPASSELIADLCSVNGGLPQGSPASPVLANIAFDAVDKALGAWCETRSIVYTRYADDLAFSGVDQMPKDIMEKIRHELAGGGWKIASGKTAIKSKPATLKLLGLVVRANDVGLNRVSRRRLRAYEHIIRTKGGNADQLTRLQGFVSYARSVSAFENERGQREEAKE